MLVQNDSKYFTLDVAFPLWPTSSSSSSAFESNAKTTSNVGDLCSGSIAGFDDESALLLMFRYEKWVLDFRMHPTNILVMEIGIQETTT